MRAGAADVIALLPGGGYVNYQGRHFTADSAKLYDLPGEPVLIAIAAPGKRSAQLAGSPAGALIAVQPDAGVVAALEAAGGSGKPQYGQLAVCHGRDAGFTHLALVQVGAERLGEFFRFAESELLPALRAR